MSFGVSRQAIKYPDADWSWHSVKEIFLEPYFMVKIFSINISIDFFLFKIDLW
jgi:hypothetical protein